MKACKHCYRNASIPPGGVCDECGRVKPKRKKSRRTNERAGRSEMHLHVARVEGFHVDNERTIELMNRLGIPAVTQPPSWSEILTDLDWISALKEIWRKITG